MFDRLRSWIGSSDEEGSVWDLTPDWQYGFAGRLHGGGDARAEQEEAVQDVAERAERFERAERLRGDRE